MAHLRIEGERGRGHTAAGYASAISCRAADVMASIGTGVVAVELDLMVPIDPSKVAMSPAESIGHH